MLDHPSLTSGFFGLVVEHWTDMQEVMGSRLGGVRTFGVGNVGLYRHRSMAGKGGMTWELFGRTCDVNEKTRLSRKGGRSVLQC